MSKEFNIKNGVLKKYGGKSFEVVIPEGVTSIEESAFNGRSNLTSVTIPDGVTCIGQAAFYGCSSLTSITIPEGVTSIGNYAFGGCSNLTSITIPDSVTSIGDGAFYLTPWLDSQQGIVKAGQVVIACKGTDKEIVIPEGVMSIGERAFYHYSSLTSVTIPEGVTSIGNHAFSDCSSLTSVMIPEGVTSIGDHAFSDCSRLTSVTIPVGVTSIGYHAFYGCSSLTSITIPEGVTSIGQAAFYGCSSLTSITIPEGVTSIGYHAFYGCSSLTSITIPEGVTNIGQAAFYGCSSLTSITIHEGVTSIGNYAFGGCSNLTSITIPDSVTSIGDSVFGGCEMLKELTFPGAKCKFGKTPFAWHSDEIPNGLKDKCFRLIPHFTDGMLKNYILETNLWETLTSEQQSEVFLSRQSSTLTPGYLKCIADNQLGALGDALEEGLKKKPSVKTCSAVTLYMTGFTEKIPVERLQKLYALLKPLEVASKSLTTIDNDPVLKKILGQELSADDTLPPAEKLVMKSLSAENRSRKYLEVQLKDYYGITYGDLPYVLGKDGKEKEPYVLAWILQAHESIIDTRWGTHETAIIYRENEIRREAKDVLDELDEESFQAALLELSRKFLAKYVNTKKKYLSYPICRYANEAVMSELTKEAAKWETSVSGIDAPPLYQMRTGCLYNNTRAAMFFAEKYHDLDKYAEIRGTDADTLRNTVLSEFDLDETGKKRYDLGNTILEAELQDDLTLSLYDQKAQKMVKTVPKRNSDPEKYEAAKKDLADMRKDIKKVAKARNNILFKDFLTGKKYDSENWKKIHFSNPLLNRIGRLLVWAQEDATFTISAEGPIDSSGTAYTIIGKPIRLAHPMEMAKADVDAWQKYYTSHNMKQPFPQVWEPVIDPQSVKEDRYSGIVLPLFTFNGRDKHGIIGSGFSAYSENFEVRFKDCDLELKPSTWRLDSWGYDEYTYTLGNFSYKEFTRYTNHIVGILDGWTIEQRIMKDDVSVVDRLDSFTLAQITEFIRKASEHNCNNVTAALLEYKNRRFAGYDPMERFWLEDF